MGRNAWSNTPVFRAMSIGMALCMTFSTAGSGIVHATTTLGTALNTAIGQIVGPPMAPHFSSPPVQRNRTVPAVGRREDRRVWTPEARMDLEQALMRRGLMGSAPPMLWASLGGIVLSGGGSGGSSLPGEGSHTGSGGSSGTGSGTGNAGTLGGQGNGGFLPGGTGFGTTNNTHTGNKLTEVPIVSWPMRGGDIAVDFRLYHSSQGSINGVFGDNWSHSFDMWIDVGLTSIIVKFPDGLSLPFTQLGARYVSAFPKYGELKANGINWDYYTKDQIRYRFDAQGDLQWIRDRHGNQITINRNGNGDISSVQDVPGSRSLTFNYTNGKVSSVTDPANRTWSFSYATQGGIDTITYPLLNAQSHTQVFAYNADDDITSHTDRRGKVWTYGYSSNKITWEKYPTTGSNPPNNETKYIYSGWDVTIQLPGHTTQVPQKIEHFYNSGVLDSIMDPAGFSEAPIYDASGNMISFIDKRVNGWAFTYDANGNVLTTTNPLGKVWTYTYNSTNDLLTIKTPLNHTTTITRTAAGDIDTVTDPLNRTIVDNDYNAQGELTQTKDALNRTTTFTYESDGDLDTIVSPASGTTTFNYNTLGRLTSNTNSSNHTTSIQYDEWMRPTRITHPGGAYMEVGYDQEGNVTSVRDERGKFSNFTFNNVGWITQFENARGDIEQYTYNANGWKTAVQNGRGHTRTYEYSIRGDLTKLTMPDNTIEQWTYWPTGEISKYTSPFSGGQAYDIDYVFDNAGQLTTVDYDTGTDTTFQYDNSGRRTQMVDATGTTTWTYNAADEVTSFVSPQGTVTRTFNTDGSLATMVDVGTGTTSYSYSSTTGQLTQITNPYNEITAFLYDTLGRLERETKHSGEYTQFGFDARNRTTSIEHRKSDNTVLSSETYDYDDAGNLEQKIVGTVTTDYTYDDINQLLSEIRVGQNYSASYTYDANGNRATRTINNVTETFHNDSGDKLTHISVGGVTVKSYAYDAAGRRTGLQDSLGTATFDYDYESRVSSISRSGSTTNTFSYNGLNTRVSKIDSAGTSTYRRAGAGVTSPVLGDGFANYTPGVSERRGSTTSYFQTDRLGTHKAQTNTSQAVTATRTFDAFGNLIASSGSSSSPFGFAGDWGYQEDPNYGLKLLGHRYYDPDAGRFLTRDPIKDGRNWYAYCDNNPLRRVDPSGLAWHDPSKIIVDEDFQGKVWIVGEPGPNQEQIFLPVLPGQSSPANMDVDIVIIQYPDGRQERYFIPGYVKGFGPSTYTIGADGKISGKPRRFNIPFPPIAPVTTIPIDRTPIVPWPFTRDGGQYIDENGRLGNWNDDIEAAKRRPGSHA